MELEAWELLISYDLRPIQACKGSPSAESGPLGYPTLSRAHLLDVLSVIIPSFMPGF